MVRGREQPLLRTYYVLLHKYANFTVTLGLTGIGTAVLMPMRSWISIRKMVRPRLSIPRAFSWCPADQSCAGDIPAAGQRAW